MRKPAMACLAGLSVLMASCLSSGFKPVSPDPRVELDRGQHDFGTIPPTETVQTVFMVTNRGGRNLEISGVQSSCGCTGGVMDSRTIRPGETGRLTVYYNPRGWNGPQAKTITLFTNDPQTPQTPLGISANVAADVPTQPPVVSPASPAVPAPGSGQR